MSKARIYPKWKVQILPVGGIVFQDEEGFNEHLIPLMNPDKWYELVIKPVSKERSRAEERYYRGVVCKMVAEAMSIESHEAHEFMAKMFLTVVEKKELANGTVIKYEKTRSTTELDDKQFDEYVFNDCIRWASLPTEEDGLSPTSGLGLYLPLPNEVEYDY